MPAHGPAQGDRQCGCLLVPLLCVFLRSHEHRLHLGCHRAGALVGLVPLREGRRRRRQRASRPSKGWSHRPGTIGATSVAGMTSVPADRSRGSTPGPHRAEGSGGRPCPCPCLDPCPGSGGTRLVVLPWSGHGSAARALVWGCLRGCPPRTGGHRPTGAYPSPSRWPGLPRSAMHATREGARPRGMPGGLPRHDLRGSRGVRRCAADRRVSHQSRPSCLARHCRARGLAHMSRCCSPLALGTPAPRLGPPHPRGGLGCVPPPLFVLRCHRSPHPRARLTPGPTRAHRAVQPNEWGCSPVLGCHSEP